VRWLFSGMDHPTGSGMAKRSRGNTAVRYAVIATALLLPTLSLAPLGGIYLWEKGCLLVWGISVAGIVFAAYLIFRAALPVPVTAHALNAEDDHTKRHPAWSPIEDAAWSDVLKIAATIELDTLDKPQGFIDLAHRTVNTVANRIHADKADAMWQFTMPEALAITERVSSRMNTFISDSIPFSERLTVSQAMQIYRWRNIAGIAEQAYNVWRIVRLSNPATALTNEARERLSRAMLQWGREHIARRLVVTFVEEVGRAAIDLYGGRLKVRQINSMQAGDVSSGSSVGIEYGAPPIRITVMSAPDAESLADEIFKVLSALEAQRSADVLAFIQGQSDEARALRLAPLIVNSAHLQTQSSKDTTAEVAKSLLETDLVILARSSDGALSSVEAAHLQEVAERSYGIPPVLVPIRFELNDGSSLSETVRYQGKVVSTVIAARTSLRQQLQASIDATSVDIRRVQMLRSVERSKRPSDWRSSSWRAVKAAARLTRSTLGR
jgi:hypothetical protein